MVKDVFCNSCNFRISQGVYAYQAGGSVFCQRCVRGPQPYGLIPTTQRGNYKEGPGGDDLTAPIPPGDTLLRVSS